jgi:hypothetical protein
MLSPTPATCPPITPRFMSQCNIIGITENKVATANKPYPITLAAMNNFHKLDSVFEFFYSIAHKLPRSRTAKPTVCVPFLQDSTDWIAIEIYPAKNLSRSRH